MNAIILAAGLGSRLKDITQKTHKALLKVFDEPNIERTIKFLKEISVNEICVVTGYKAEDFLYLESKFGVKLLFNKNFATQNNLSSFCVALEFFGDSFIIDADVVMLENILKQEKNSTLYTTIRNSPKKEWILKTKNGFANSIEIASKKEPSLLGISYFNKDDALKIKEKISTLKQEFFNDQELYYDNVIASMYDKIQIKQRIINNSLVCEIDDLDDIKELEEKMTRKI